MVDIKMIVVPDAPFQFADFEHKIAKVEYRLFDKASFDGPFIHTYDDGEPVYTIPGKYNTVISIGDVTGFTVRSRTAQYETYEDAFAQLMEHLKIWENNRNGEFWTALWELHGSATRQ